MYRWYISIEKADGEVDVVRSNADTLDKAKEEIEQLYPGFKYMGHAEVGPVKEIINRHVENR